MTITEFLLARIAEDEAVARNAAMSIDDDRRPDWSEAGSGVLDTGDELWPIGDSRISRHAKHFDPERVLAECEAKRRIVEELALPYIAERRRLMRGQPDWGDEHPELLRFLALPYADHPDYNAAWAA